MGTELGVFIKTKREEKNISLRSLALNVKISTTYLSDIENGRRTGVSDDILQNIAKILELSEPDSEKLYTLASKEKGTIPLDVTNFIKDNEEVVAFLRQANKGKHEEWLKKLKDEKK